MISSETNKYLSNFDDMTLFYKIFLRFIGILPIDGLNNYTYLTSRLHLVYCFIWSTIYWTMHVFYFINEFRNRVPTTDSICETVLVISTITRYYLLLRNRLKFAKLLDECRTIWDIYNENGHRIIRRFEYKIRLVFKLLFGTCFITNFMYTVTAVSLTINSNFRNNTNVRYLPFKWYNDDITNLWPGCKVTFLIQIVVMQNLCVATSCIDVAGPYLIMIAAGYFRALRERFLIIDEDDDFELFACLRLHQRIINFCSKINEITRSLFFIQLICNIYNISLLGFKIVSSDPDKSKYLAFILTSVLQLYICQWAPDHLIDESTSISTAVYSISFNWMRNRRLGKLLILIIARSQKPVRMTAAGFIYLSLENFGTMLTSAIFFFTVLRNF